MCVLTRNREIDLVRAGQLSRDAGTGPSWTEPTALEPGRVTQGTPRETQPLPEGLGQDSRALPPQNPPA